MFHIVHSVGLSFFLFIRGLEKGNVSVNFEYLYVNCICICICHCRVGQVVVSWLPANEDFSIAELSKKHNLRI